jgi:CcmD family protein
MTYLFWAHVVCWAGVLIYVYSLIRRVSSIEKEINALKGSFGSSGKDDMNLLRQGVK